MGKPAHGVRGTARKDLLVLLLNVPGRRSDFHPERIFPGTCRPPEIKLPDTVHIVRFSQNSAIKEYFRKRINPLKTKHQIVRRKLFLGQRKIRLKNKIIVHQRKRVQLIHPVIGVGHQSLL